LARALKKVRNEMMRPIISVSLALLMLGSFFPKEVLPATGTVVYTRGGCDYFIAETWMGYALLEWYGGARPEEGDIIMGDFENLGRNSIYNFTKDSEMIVWVENFWLSRTGVTEEFAQRCPK
jgi:hypothetical protein